MKTWIAAGVLALAVSGASEAQRSPVIGRDVAMACTPSSQGGLGNIIIYHNVSGLTIPAGTQVTVVYYAPLTNAAKGPFGVLGPAGYQEITTNYMIRHNMPISDPEIAVYGRGNYCKSATAHIIPMITQQ